MITEEGEHISYKDSLSEAVDVNVHNLSAVRIADDVVDALMQMTPSQGHSGLMLYMYFVVNIFLLNTIFT